jgi:hypothetical protein
MATMPAANYLTDNARTEGEFKAGLEAMLASTKQIPGAGVAELAITIAAGSITPAGSGGALVIDTESSAASDDLANIVQTNYPDGSMLLLRNANAARVVVCKHAATGSGQLMLNRSVDYVLDDTKKLLLLQRRGTDWYEIWRSPAPLAMPTVNKTANFTINKEDHGKVFSLTGTGPITVSFAASASLGSGFCVGIINNHSLDNEATLDPNASERVDALTNLRLSRGRAVLLVCDGTEFWTIGNRQRPRYTSVNYAASLTLNAHDADWIEVGPLTGNVTTLQVDADVGTRTRIRFKQDATGGRTVANPSGAKITGSIDATASKVSYLDLYYCSADLRWEGFWATVPV